MNPRPDSGGIVFEDSQMLAVALNGMVVATTVTSPSEKRRQDFAVLIPPSAFQQGENIIELFRIITYRGHPALRPLPLV